MNHEPLLRKYQQMARIVQTDTRSATSYKMGNSYGETTSPDNEHGSSDSSDYFSVLFAHAGVSPTELQIRTLNEMNLPSTSLRRPEAPALNGYLPTRTSSILYHELNSASQHYLNGQGGNPVNRKDTSPGTKQRTGLGKGAFTQKILTQVAYQPDAAQSKNKGTEGAKHSDQAKQHKSVFNAFK